MPFCQSPPSSFSAERILARLSTIFFFKKWSSFVSLKDSETSRQAASYKCVVFTSDCITPLAIYSWKWRAVISSPWTTDVTFSRESALYPLSVFLSIVTAFLPVLNLEIKHARTKKRHNYGFIGSGDGAAFCDSLSDPLKRTRRGNSFF